MFSTTTASRSARLRTRTARRPPSHRPTGLLERGVAPRGRRRARRSAVRSARCIAPPPSTAAAVIRLFDQQRLDRLRANQRGIGSQSSACLRYGSNRSRCTRRRFGVPPEFAAFERTVKVLGISPRRAHSSGNTNRRNKTTRRIFCTPCGRRECPRATTGSTGHRCGNAQRSHRPPRCRSRPSPLDQVAEGCDATRSSRLAPSSIARCVIAAASNTGFHDHRLDAAEPAPIAMGQVRTGSIRSTACLK